MVEHQPEQERKAEDQAGQAGAAGRMSPLTLRKPGADKERAVGLEVAKLFGISPRLLMSPASPPAARNPNDGPAAGDPGDPAEPGQADSDPGAGATTVDPG